MNVSLAPGQPRYLVEEQLTGMMLPQVDPVDVSSGKPVCRERYSVNLTRPVPGLTPAGPEGFAPGPYTLTVEFGGLEDLERLYRIVTEGRPKVVAPATS